MQGNSQPVDGATSTAVSEWILPEFMQPVARAPTRPSIRPPPRPSSAAAPSPGFLTQPPPSLSESFLYHRRPQQVLPEVDLTDGEDSDFEEDEGEDEQVSAKIMGLPPAAGGQQRASTSKKIPDGVSGDLLGLKSDPPCFKEGLPGLATLREDSSLTAGVNLLVSGWNGLQMHFDARFAAVSSKSSVGGMKHYDEPRAVNLTTILSLEEQGFEASQVCNEVVVHLAVLNSQLEGLALMTYGDIMDKAERIVMKTCVQELLWRIAQFSLMFSELVDKVCDQPAVTTPSGRRSARFDWAPLEKSYSGFCSEVATMYSSFGLVPVVRIDGQLQWAHTPVTHGKLSPLINGMLVIIASIQAKVFMVHQQPIITPLLKLVRRMVDPDDNGPNLSLFLPAPVFNKNLSEVLGLETRAQAKARLLVTSEVFPIYHDLYASSSGWLEEVSLGCRDVYLQSAWRSRGLYHFQANAMICSGPEWLVMHKSWLWGNTFAKVCQLFIQVQLGIDLKHFCCRSLRVLHLT